MAVESRRMVLAGNVIDELSNLQNDIKVTLGPGLRRESDKIVASKCGILKKKGNSTYWIDNYQKRYVPVRGEYVLGIVTSRAGDTFKVDIGSSEPATLSYLAFEGATKRNRPNVQIGDVVYAKLLVAAKDMEPELVCVDRHGKSAGMGIPEDNGFMFQAPLNIIRKISSPHCNALKSLGEHFRFESAIGMNGRIWIRGRNVKETIAISNAILLTENMTNDEIDLMCQKLADALPRF